MTSPNKTYNELLEEAADLREKLDEANNILHAIQNGEIDALVISAPDGEKVYTLKGADYTYRVLLEQMHEGAVIINSSGLIVYGNKYLEQLLQCPLEKVIGALLYDFFSASDEAAFKSYANHSHSGNTRVELNMLSKKGSSIPVSISIATIQIEQEEFDFIVITDLTEQKLKEKDRLSTYKKVNQIFNATPVGICVIDREGTIIQVNTSLVQMFNLEKMEVTGKKCNTLFGNDSCNSKSCSIIKILEGSEIENYEFNKIFLDGKKLTFSVKVVPLKNLNGEITGIIKNFSDITVQRNTENTFQSLLEDERQIVSFNLHESLCQILAATNYKLESVQSDLEKTAPHLQEKINETMNIIQNAITQAQTISRGLSPVKVNSGGFMDALEELTATMLSIYDVRCKIKYNKKIYFTDSMKASYLYLIILKAVNNSLYYMKAKNIYLNFTTKDGNLFLSITDDGTYLQQTDNKNMKLDFKIMEYRTQTIGATFGLSTTEKGSYQILINNLPIN